MLSDNVVKKIKYTTHIKRDYLKLLFKYMPGVFVLLVICLAILVVKDYSHYSALFLGAAPSNASKSTGADLFGNINFTDNSSILEVDTSSSMVKSSITGNSKEPVQDKNLLLMGTVIPGYAFFEDKPSKRQRIFTEGESVFDRGVLVSVDAYSAQVDIEGTLFTYKMTSAGGQSDVPIVKSLRPQNYTIAARPGFYQHQTPLSNEYTAKRTGVDRWEINSETVSKVLNDIDSVSDHARLSSYMEEGVAKGYRVGSIKPSGVLSNVGLKNGDVILNVNGYSATSTTEMMMLYGALKLQGKMDISIDLLRGGKAKTLNYNML